MAAQTSSLAVPSSQRPRPFRLRLAERIAEHVEEIVGIRFRQLRYEFVAILDELAIVPVGVLIQHHLTQVERLESAARRGPATASAVTVTVAWGLKLVPATLPVTVYVPACSTS